MLFVVSTASLYYKILVITKFSLCMYKRHNTHVIFILVRTYRYDDGDAANNR